MVPLMRPPGYAGEGFLVYREAEMGNDLEGGLFLVEKQLEERERVSAYD